MLQELTHMDRITQLQDEIQQILVIMSNTITYLTTRTNFLQVSEAIPVTKQRKADKFDPPDVFQANQKELVTDLVTKAKQIEYLINSLPEPEPEETQALLARRLKVLEQEMTTANEEYAQAVSRAKDLHAQITDVLKTMLDHDDTDLLQAA
ncbi:hypothetical protein FA13DRAFT_1632305 [Coprinellus micaceus]|uniref:Mediator of RNA polymerase II transcription subunit 21 n=1 Tax=Coprinellus micaceus TaxID=71717 RepID=A0A4Y7T5T5_COPMI|nr:hypothetical protein FA13DRAFT_1632305 [Coprinellus micaceus]